MPDPFAKTRYRVAQHWRYHSETPEARHVFIILGVEDHPKQGIVCDVYVEYDPPFATGPNGSLVGCESWLTQAALDRSVIELVEDRGPLPRHFGTTGEFRLGKDYWVRHPVPMAADQSVGEMVRQQTEQNRRLREQAMAWQPQPEPPVESLGLWSLIAGDEAERFEELLEQGPALANQPLPQDETDDYCYGYEDCYPLMLAAELGSALVARVLLERGADPRQHNAAGDTALHFAGRSSTRGEEPAVVARLLCERGADSQARNAEGKTPLTCGYCMDDVAAVLIHFGATPTLNHAIRLRMIEWARRELRDNPGAMRDAPFPSEVLDDLVYFIRDEAERRHGREARLARGETPAGDEDGWPDRMAAMSLLSYHAGSPLDGLLAVWRRRAEVERAVFEEHRDLFDTALVRGANPNAGSTLFDAVQMFDTSLAEWLMGNGADPNRDVKKGTASYLPDLARTRRMLNLLERFGARSNPYTKAADPWDDRMKQLTDRLRDRFD
jgi:hypothetical protein